MSNEFKIPSSQVLVKKKNFKNQSFSKLYFAKRRLYSNGICCQAFKKYIQKSESEAINIMLMVHKKGSGVCGIFTKEIIETKVFMVMKMAKNDQHPLKCIMEPE